MPRHTALIVYEEIPERTRFFLVDLDDAEFEKMKACNGMIINVDEWPESEWLTEQVDGVWSGGEQVSEGVWKKSEIDVSESGGWFLRSGTVVFHTGFYL